MADAARLTSAINGLPYPPALGRKPDIPGDLAALSGVLDSRLVSRFPSTTARDLAIPAENRVPGMLSWIDSMGVWTGVDGNKVWSRRVGSEVQHREFLGTNSGIPNATLWGSTGWTLDATRSWGGDSCIIEGESLRFPRSGIYAVSLIMGLSQITNGRSFVELATTYNAGRVTFTGDDNATINFPNLLLYQDALIQPRIYKQTADNLSSATWRVRVTRVMELPT